VAEKAGGDGGDGGGEVEERGQRVPREARRARTGTGVDPSNAQGEEGRFELTDLSNDIQNIAI